VQVGLLGLAIFGVAGHRDIAPRALLGHCRLQLGGIEQPPLQILGVRHLAREQFLDGRLHR